MKDRFHMFARFAVLLLGIAVIEATAPAHAQFAPTSPETTIQGSGLGFGGALAVADGEVFVGSAPIGWPRGDEPAGEVYRYTLAPDGTWQEAGRLTASDGAVGDDFGRSIATDGSRLVVGAPGNAAAYVFERSDDGSWMETAKLVPSTLSGDAEFGGAYARAGARSQNIALLDGAVAVTAYDASSNTGTVHVFTDGADGWMESDIIRPDDAVDGDGFGFAVAGHGNLLAAGAPAAERRRGAVYAYTLDETGSATLAARLHLEGVDGPTGLGGSIVFHAHHLVAGAPLAAGSGIVVAWDAHAEWAELARVGPPDQNTMPSSGFGGSVAISSTDILVSARRGVVFASPFSPTPTFQRITAPDERRGPAFGVGLAVGGDVAVIGSPGADYEAGVATVYERSAASGRWIESAILASEVGHFAAMTGEEISCEDGKAGAFSCDNINLVSFLPISDLSSSRGVGMTDVWGWTDPETGKEWVLAGRTDGVAFVDISDPANPVYVGELPKTADSPGSGWRDVKVYNNHAYVVADGARHHGVQVFDLTRLRDVDPAEMPVTFRESNWYGGTASTHNFVVNEESGYGYAVGNRAGGETCGGQLHMIDLSDPGNPAFAGCYAHPEGGGTHDSQCVMYVGPDADYQGREICFNSNGGSFIIADVSDKNDPQTVIKTDYPNLAYTHQGWLTEDHRYFYMNDELDEMNALVNGTRTLIWDVADLDDPTLVGEYMHDAPASDHNLYIKGDLMYQANYQAGLQILDISDPLNPVLVGEFDTVPFGEDEAGFGGAWSTYPWFESGVLPVTSRGEGLFIVRQKEQDS
ncbi:MAG: choice-of-anchor B family protein [Rhodothermales bacterium]|nr:choice-of-anchor B family protein [Rhodothermales bacterium]